MRKKIFLSFLALSCALLVLLTGVLVFGAYRLEQRQLAESLSMEADTLASALETTQDNAALPPDARAIDVVKDSAKVGKAPAKKKSTKKKAEESAEGEEAAAEEALDRLDRKLEQTMRAVEASYEKNKERWVDTLFSLIVGVQP